MPTSWSEKSTSGATWTEQFTTVPAGEDILIGPWMPWSESGGDGWDECSIDATAYTECSVAATSWTEEGD